MNQQLAIEIEEAKIPQEVQPSPAIDPPCRSKLNKKVHWNDVQEEIVVEHYIGIKDGLDDDMCTGG